MPATSDPLVAADVFFSGALPRIRRFMLLLAAVATVAVGLGFGSIAALGFAVGAAIAWLNFYWLKSTVEHLGDTIGAGRPSRSTRRVVGRYLLRYVLIAVGAYAIVTFSRVALYGFLAALFLPVGAILCEAAYELYVALRRGY